MRAQLMACLAAAAAAGLTACGSVAVSGAGDVHGQPGGTLAAVSSPAAGSRAAAAALARLLLSRLHLPSGARRLPLLPVPHALRAPLLDLGAYAELDLHQLFQLPEPMGDVAATLTASHPVGMELWSTGGPGGPPGGVTDFMDVSFADRSPPAGIYMAQLVLTVAPAQSGRSLLRADAQVIWFPPRSAAEYIDPARYHALTITVEVWPHRMRKVVTSPTVISRLAGALNRSPAQPVRVFSCPMIIAIYRLMFSSSLSATPVVVTATEAPCEGVGVTVGGRLQPPLQDEGAVVAMADRLLGVTAKDLYRLDGS